MEFYLRILEMFCKLRDGLLSIFGGGKVLCAGLVSYCEFLPLIFSVLGRFKLTLLYRKMSCLHWYPPLLVRSSRPEVTVM